MVRAPFTGVKVFSTTLARDRETMGDTITRWLRANPALEIVDRVVTQSSDKEFHCPDHHLFYRHRRGLRPNELGRRVRRRGLASRGRLPKQTSWPMRPMRRSFRPVLPGMQRRRQPALALVARRRARSSHALGRETPR